MGLSAVYTVNTIVDAVKHADTYRYAASITGKSELIDLVVDAELAFKSADFTEQEQTVINCRVFGTLFQEEVAELLGVSQPRICQIEAEINSKLQIILSRWEREYAD